jgi:hypothetical protein
VRAPGVMLSGGSEPPSDVMVERLNEPVLRDLESAAQIIPDCDADLVASLGGTQKGITAIAADIAAGSGTHFPPRDEAPDIVLRAVGVERYLRAVQHYQQRRLVEMQPCQQTVQRDEASAAEEDVVEPRAQSDSPARTRVKLVNFKAGVEVPDQAANPCLSSTMAIGEGVQLYAPAVQQLPSIARGGRH